MASALDLPQEFVAGTRDASNHLIKATHYGNSLGTLKRLEIDAESLSTRLIEEIRAGSSGSQGLKGMAALGENKFDLAESEIAACAFFLIWAGIETTSALLGSAIYLMAEHPAELARWRRNPQATRSFLDEVMRFAGPLRRLNARIAQPDLRLSEIAIEGGMRVVAVIEEAHRDPAAYPDPTRFDPARRGPPHLGFGVGPHACLGGVLAYREAAILIDILFRRFDVELPDSVPHWDDHPDFRRLERLDVILRPAENHHR
jgi:cytochrome P450